MVRAYLARCISIAASYSRDRSNPMSRWPTGGAHCFFLLKAS
jgi:hypothetical protein